MSYRDYWPSLFAARPGTATDMHVDAFASNFFSTLLAGSKRWTLFPAAQTHHLYRRWPTTSFDVNMSNLITAGQNCKSLCINGSTLKSYPLARHLTPWIVDLQPGELLLVPHNIPHFVQNLPGDRLVMALSGNYIDASNLAAALPALAHIGLTDPTAAWIYASLEQQALHLSMDWSRDVDLTFMAFKKMSSRAVP